MLRAFGRGWMCIVIGWSLASVATAQDRRGDSPWGISSSAGSYKNHAEWLPKLAAAGVTSVRLFPEWREFERSPGTFNWDKADALVQAAEANKIEINAILMGSPPESKKAHAFPMADLDAWSNYVSAVVGRYKGRIRYWEVWNEGNGGFNDDKHTTTDYAKLAIATYTAAKKADPAAQVGLSVASFDAPYLHQAMLAMAKEGKPNSFDFLAIHPYEIADGLADTNGEVPFLWMTKLLRDALKSAAPERANCEIWITEIARRIEKKKERSVSEEDAAKALVKIYTMAAAQGIRRTQWFEAQDPAGEDQGFGLINRAGELRPSYQAFKTMVGRLGPSPKYVGWLGGPQKGYGFVFQVGASHVLVAWSSAGQAASSITCTADVVVVDALTDSAIAMQAGEILHFTERPVYVVGIPDDVVKLARGNGSKNFPWGGDFSAAQIVRGHPGNPDGDDGVFQVNRDSTPTIKFADGSTGILRRGDQSATFYVHPSFASLLTKEYYVRVKVRRIAPGNVGMNLFYQAADGQGRAPYKNREQWYSVGAADGWQTHTWHVTDACFSKLWGYDISFRPEQSVPFVIGGVEVSGKAFE